MVSSNNPQAPQSQPSGPCGAPQGGSPPAQPAAPSPPGAMPWLLPPQAGRDRDKQSRLQVEYQSGQPPRKCLGSLRGLPPLAPPLLPQAVTEEHRQEGAWQQQPPLTRAQLPRKPEGGGQGWEAPERGSLACHGSACPALSVRLLGAARGMPPL